MYHFKEEWNRRGHFWFDKKLIENKNWAILSKASKSVFPVIASHRNEKGEAFPGEQAIAILSGLSDKTVRQGIRGLEDFPGIEIQNYVTKRGRRSKRYKIDKPPEVQGRSFPFYRGVFEGGNWLHLIPSAQALYPVMRYFGYFDSVVCEIYLYEEDAGGYDLHDFDAVYKDRKWDFCIAELDILAEYAGISKRSVYDALRSLGDNHLIENYSDEDLVGWKVFLLPTTIYNRDYLNEKTRDKYRHLNARLGKKLPVMA
ncbi:helix-turn-helix domain-containing protein [Desulforhopalus singaporensis]|uniref:Helix-turn-helix domain-containing protein n=1 Tax=Desulforhopalus singaporensis TaxID=91360 RepID=A0A1H0TV98_9BACT|nr:helix-turn-helix domain-containing protein [Desulforhopalus singaporensis]SDP57680.1 Helix-turn-helix domain-containing protein [Desulforhopalus singaporensis]